MFTPTARIARSAAFSRPKRSPISIDPPQPPRFNALPATWTPTIRTTLPRVKWAVFRVDETGRFTSADQAYREVDVPTGSFQPAVPISQERDRLVVKDIAETPGVEAVSGGAILDPTAPAPAVDGLTAAKAFVSDLTVGVNVERNKLIRDGLITTPQLQEYKNQGMTHVRFFPHWGHFNNAGFPDIAGGAGDWFFDAIERAMGVGLKVPFALLDIEGEEEMKDPQVMTHLRACAERIKARNWNVTRYAVGAVNEYGGGTNAGHQAKRLEALSVLRSVLPNTLLMSASANWNEVWVLLNGSYAPGSDTRVIHEWHYYADNAGALATTQDIQNNVGPWAARNNLVTLCGEYSKGPPNGLLNGNLVVGPDNYHEWPGIIDAACRGMGQQRPTIWVVTDGTHWKQNQDGSAALQPAVATAYTAGNAHIRQQPWFTGVAAPQPTTPPPATSPATAVDAEYPAYTGGARRPTGKSGPLQTGQSNTGFFIDEAIWIENEGLAAILGVEQGTYNPGINGIARLDAYALNQGARTNPDAFTAVGGTPLFDRGSNYPFLDATGGGAASGWPFGHSGNALDTFIRTVMTAEDRAGCMGVQILHNERDTEINTDPDEMLAARLNWMGKVRAAFGRPASGADALPFYFLFPIPYGGNGSGHAAIRRAWSAIVSNPANNAHMVVWQTADSAGGLRYGATERDYSHRATEDLRNFARRATFGVARVLNSQRGVGNPALPSFGPKILHCYAEAANSTLLTIGRDRGDALRLGAGAGDGRGWSIDDTNFINITAVEIASGNQIRLRHDAATGGRRIGYCVYGQELGQGGAIYDNFSAKPLPSGWPTALGADWRFDWPLRATLVPMPVSATPAP